MKLIIVIPLTLLFLSLFCGCSESERLQPSGAFKNISFSDTLPFTEYLSITKELLIKYRITTDKKSLLHDEVTAVAPFEWTPKNPNGKGVLLVHGLTDSPFTMRDMAHSFLERGYVVRTVLLPGHGTRPGDLLHTKYSDWIEATLYGINSFDATIDTLFTVGYSTGATALFYSLLDDKRLKREVHGIIAMAPAIGVNEAAKWGRWVRYVRPWFEKWDDKNSVKYESFAMNGGWQTYSICKALKDRCGNRSIKTPTLLIASDDDATVDFSVAQTFFNDNIDARKKALIYSRTPQESDSMVTYRSALYDSLHIYSYSHMALPFRATNRQYGEEGRYHYCLQFKDNPDFMETCLDSDNDTLQMGEKGILFDKPYRRLTFNPDFDYMMEEMISFLEKS